MNGNTEARTPWESLVPVCLAIFLINLDLTVVNLALPTIARDLHAGLSIIQWVVNGYLAAGASFLIFQGRLADSLGRRRVFVGAALVFVTGSALTAAAAEPWHLVLGRVIQGLGVGVFPIAMAHIQVAFPAKDRNTALGIATATAGAAAALGPTLGGVMLHLVSWRWAFLINVPLGIAAILTALLWMRETSKVSRLHLDWIGQTLLCVGLLSLLTALNEGQTWGYGSAAFIGVALTGIVLLLVFLRVEKHCRNPILDLGLFRIPSFTIGNTVRFLFQYVSLSIVFLVCLYIQNVLGQSPLTAGLTLLWFTATTGILSPLIGKSLDKIGLRGALMAGMGILASASLLFSIQSAYSPLGNLFLPLLLCGLAFSLILPATVSAVLSSVPQSKTTQASGVLYTTAFLGGAVGIALTGLVLHLVSLGFAASLAKEGISLTPDQIQCVDHAASGLHVSLGHPGSLPPAVAERIGAGAREAFTGAFALNMRIYAILCAIGVVLGALLPASEASARAE